MRNTIQAALIRANQPPIQARMWALAAFSLFVLAFTVWAEAARAQSPADQPDTAILTGLPVGVILVSVAMTLVGYVLNWALPILKTDAQKGWATTFYQGLGVVGFQLAFGDGFAFDQATGVAFLVAMGTYGAAHGLIFKPFDWSTRLGAGRNLQDDPSR